MEKKSTHNNTGVVPPLGVIEGFYGKAWSWQQRMEMAQFMAQAGYELYLYAPKSDRHLRSAWQLPWSNDNFNKLLKLGRTFHQYELSWGLGLSPLNLFQAWTRDNKTQLRDKIELINGLGIDVLCILFDDMRGDVENLATHQLDIVEFIVTHSNASKHIVCPTYYSLDPVLEKVFGAMPKGYWEEIGKGLPTDIGLFWTGSQVCSKSYTQHELQAVSDLFRRLPTLWDNYPVNDGRITSNFLHIDAYRGRPANIGQCLQSHIVNPMNAASLSRIPLLTLFESYSAGEQYDPDAALLSAIRSVCGGGDLSVQLEQDWRSFQLAGLSELDAAAKQQLREVYGAFKHPCAREIVAWLEGFYKFDEACLTE